MSTKRVVITGMGALTPIGNTIDEIFHNLSNGISGIDTIAHWDPSNLPVRIAGEVKNFDPLAYFEPQQAKFMDRVSQYSIVASRMALKDAGLLIDEHNSDDVGVLIGSAMGKVSTIENECAVLFTEGPQSVKPHMATKSNVSVVASDAAKDIGATGVCFAPASACAAGSHAIGESFEIIRRGDAKVMIAGGSDACVQPMSMAGLAALRALSKRNDEPQKASRPFDKGRDGFVMGEGAGIVVLEDLDHALGRGASIYAELVGYGASSDAFHETAIAHERLGAARSMRKALKKAGMSPTDVQHINTHGTSTPMGDPLEIKAIKQVFKEHAYALKINSTKSMTGHPQGAAGAIELIACILSINNSIVFPTINVDDQDPECDLDVVPNKAIHMPIEVALSNSLGFGGQNATLIVKKYHKT